MDIDMCDIHVSVFSNTMNNKEHFSFFVAAGFFLQLLIPPTT